MAQDPHKAAAASAMIRGRRARFRREARRTDVVGMLLSPPAGIATADVEWLLKAAHGIGRERAASVLREQQISPTRAVGSLTRRQRRNLAEALQR